MNKCEYNKAENGSDAEHEGHTIARNTEWYENKFNGSVGNTAVHEPGPCDNMM